LYIYSERIPGWEKEEEYLNIKVLSQKRSSKNSSGTVFDTVEGTQQSQHLFYNKRRTA